MEILLLNRVENIVAKREIAPDEQFLHFSQCIQKQVISYAMTIATGDQPNDTRFKIPDANHMSRPARKPNIMASAYCVDPDAQSA